MIYKITIYGERCSGTTYLQNLMLLNFNVTLTWEYGWKHFFGFQNELLKNSDDTLFICIVRHPINWINSFYRSLHHSPLKYSQLCESDKIYSLLNNEFWSVNDNNPNNAHDYHEIMEDRHIYTGNRYNNVFEMRHTKMQFLLEDLPTKVKNYIVVRYEDLLDDLENVMTQLKCKNLQVRDNIIFPVNTTFYKNSKKNLFNRLCQKENLIDTNLILTNQNLNKYYENQLGYVMPDAS